MFGILKFLKVKIKKLIDTRGINTTSIDQPIKKEQKSVIEDQADLKSSKSSSDFDEGLYRIFVNFALLLANADGLLKIVVN